MAEKNRCFHVYILRCSDDRYYVGWKDDCIYPFPLVEKPYNCRQELSLLYRRIIPYLVLLAMLAGCNAPADPSALQHPIHQRIVNAELVTIR